MRPIKFRAFDIESGTMFYSDKKEDDTFFEFNENGKLRGFVIRQQMANIDPMQPPEPYCDDYDVMQFTGLLDKNGKEIYEGDVITYDTDEGTVIATVGFDVSHEGDEFLSGFLPQDAYINDGCEEPVNGIEVIGNIYENPELVKEEHDKK